ncbi:hypothetical protein ACJX0J_019168 [Zea mays]
MAAIVAALVQFVAATVVATTVVAGMIVVVIGQLGGTSFSKQQISYQLYRIICYVLMGKLELIISAMLVLLYNLVFTFTTKHPKYIYDLSGMFGHSYNNIKTHAGMRAPLSSTSHIELLVQSVATIVVAGMIVVVIGQLVVLVFFSKQQIRYR